VSIVRELEHPIVIFHTDELVAVSIWGGHLALLGLAGLHSLEHGETLHDFLLLGRVVTGTLAEGLQALGSEEGHFWTDSAVPRTVPSLFAPQLRLAADASIVYEREVQGIRMTFVG